MLRLSFFFAFTFIVAFTSAQPITRTYGQSSAARQHVYGFEENGVVFKTIRKKQNTDDVYEHCFTLYGTNTVRKKTTPIYETGKLTRGSRTDIFQTSQSLHYLREFAKNEFTLHSVKVPSMTSTEITFSIENKSYLTPLKVLGDYAYLRAHKKSTSTLYVINWKQGKVTKKVFKGETVHAYFVIPESQELVIVSEPKNAMLKEFDGQVYDAHFQPTYTIKLPKGLKTMWENTQVFKVDTTFYFMGCFINRDGYSRNGFFLCSTSANGSAKTKYHAFYNIDEHMESLVQDPKFLERVKKNKEAYKYEKYINPKVDIRKVVKADKGFVFGAEVFLSYSRSRPDPSNPLPPSDEHYLYTHHLVAHISFDGNLTWTNVLKGGYEKPHQAFAHISDDQGSSALRIAGDSIYAILPLFDSVRTIIMRASTGEISYANYQPLKSKIGEQKIRGVNWVYMHWYDDNFLIRGSLGLTDMNGEKTRLGVFKKIQF